MPKSDETKGNEEQEQLDANKKGLTNYAKYTGVAFQMMAIIAASAFIGYKIDDYYDHNVRWVTALLCVFGVCLSIYQTIRQLKE